MCVCVCSCLLVCARVCSPQLVCARVLLVCARVCFSWPVCVGVSVFASFVVVCARTGKPTSLEELCRALCSRVLMLYGRNGTDHTRMHARQKREAKRALHDGIHEHASPSPRSTRVTTSLASAQALSRRRVQGQVLRPVPSWPTASRRRSYSSWFNG